MQWHGITEGRSRNRLTRLLPPPPLVAAGERPVWIGACGAAGALPSTAVSMEYQPVGKGVGGSFGEARSLYLSRPSHRSTGATWEFDSSFLCPRTLAVGTPASHCWRPVPRCQAAEEASTTPKSTSSSVEKSDPQVAAEVPVDRLPWSRARKKGKRFGGASADDQSSSDKRWPRVDIGSARRGVALIEPCQDDRGRRRLFSRRVGWRRGRGSLDLTRGVSERESATNMHGIWVQKKPL